MQKKVAFNKKKCTYYLDRLKRLIDQVKSILPAGTSVEVKPFFGGTAAYVDGCIFISFTKVGWGLNLPENDRTALFDSMRAKQLSYFPKALVKKQYVLFPISFLDDTESVKLWMKRSISFALSDSQ